jgi:hypothetical protein
MRRQRHFEIASATALREAAVITDMMVHLNRSVCLLDCDIATEEERARISDRSNSGYPILARTLAARRDNLRDTIASLEQRLTTIKAPLVEAVAAQRPLTSIEVSFAPRYIRTKENFKFAVRVFGPTPAFRERRRATMRTTSKPSLRGCGLASSSMQNWG